MPHKAMISYSLILLRFEPAWLDNLDCQRQIGEHYPIDMHRDAALERGHRYVCDCGSHSPRNFVD